MVSAQEIKKRKEIYCCQSEHQRTNKVKLILSQMNTNYKKLSLSTSKLPLRRSRLRCPRIAMVNSFVAFEGHGN